MDSNIEITDNSRYLTLKCADGEHSITDWDDSMDILDYSSFTIAYMPLDSDTSKFHCISKLEDEALTARRDKAYDDKLKAEEEANRAKHEKEMAERMNPESTNE